MYKDMLYSMEIKNKQKITKYSEKIEFEDVPKKDVYKDYIYIGTSEEASDNFQNFYQYV